MILQHYQHTYTCLCISIYLCCILTVYLWIAVKEILKLCPAETLTTIYKLPSFDSVDDFLFKVATLRGKLKKGGVVDISAAARIVLHDWNEGAYQKLTCYFT